MNFEGVTSYNRTVILSSFLDLSEKDRAHFLLKNGLTENEVERFLSGDTGSLTEQQLMVFPEYRLHKLLLMYVPPILLFFGTIGNVLSFIILRHRLMSKQSTYFYLATLAIADSLVLFVGALRLWIGALTDLDVKDYSDVLCKMVVFLGYTTSDISVWLIIAVTVERYIVVCHPLQTNTMCNLPRAKRVIVCLIFGLTLINLHFFWTVEITNGSREHVTSLIVNGNDSCVCRGGKAFTHLVEDLWPWVDAILYSFLPFFVITFLNCVIIHRVTQAYRSRCIMQKRDTINGDSRSGCRPSGCGESSTKMTAMLLTISFSFLLTTLPMNVCLIASALWVDQGTSSLAKFTLAETVTKLLMYTNHSINFFLYCATGQKFRQHLLKLICSKGVYQLTVSEETHYSLKLNAPIFRKQRLIAGSEDTKKLTKAKVTYV